MRSFDDISNTLLNILKNIEIIKNERKWIINGHHSELRQGFNPTLKIFFIEITDIEAENNMRIYLEKMSMKILENIFSKILNISRIWYKKWQQYRMWKLWAQISK